MKKLFFILIYFNNYLIKFLFLLSKDKKPVFEDKSGPCLSLCYDKSKSYLFAGFANGVIKVYKTSAGEN